MLAYRKRFRQFLATHGVVDRQVNAMHKIAWLESFVDPDNGYAYHTLDNMARAIRQIGPNRKAELEEQHELVLAFLAQLKRSAHVKPPNDPSPLMLKSDFRQVLATFRPDTFFGSRARATHLLVWWTGLAEISLSQLKLGWIKPRRKLKGITLRWLPSHAHAYRQMAVPKSKDPTYCAVAAVEDWLRIAGAPTDPQAYVFPLTQGSARINTWYEPFQEVNALVGVPLRLALAKIGHGHKGYNTTSIRRAHALRSLKELGPGLALYRSGFGEERSFRRLLRAEPDWNSLPPSLLD
ncbi:MAG TPA: hypothetical protein VFO29_01710 [Candidatus Rubrimentiphilum sp.]|nr:hypothetical protein [Candidatus Rubrimentiphilum sp.]